MPEHVFGHVPGYPPGSHFANRRDLSRSGVHRPLVAGIAGSAYEGAESVVLSGGYEDSRDHGDVIIYTGHGGRDPDTGKQIAHQTLVRGNQALALSHARNLPIRVVRGARQPSPYAPADGYRYDGLFHVADYWRERGRSGYYVWYFKLVKRPD